MTGDVRVGVAQWTAINLVDYYLIRHGEYDVVTVPLYYLLAMRQVARRPAASPEPARN
jgi:hypothetical protein